MEIFPHLSAVYFFFIFFMPNIWEIEICSAQEGEETTTKKGIAEVD